jgi:SAM-dependent methyltransferase
MSTALELLRTVRPWGYSWPGREVAEAHLSELSEFLRVIGLATPGGEVFRDRAGKFEQAVGLALQLEAVLRKLPKKRELVLVDAGCGRNYLSFIANHYLGRFQARRLHFIGVDGNPGLIQRCRQVQQELGWVNLEFHVSKIADFRPPRRPDIVMSLHACDTATDEALALGVRERARFLLAVACCQDTAHAQLEAGELAPVSRHAPYKERLADMFADSLRALLLESVGYRVQLIEFVPSSATPKNILLRAEWIGFPRPQARAQADQLARSFGVRPALARFMQSRQ